MFNVYIGIGSNLGNKIENCLNALKAISEFTAIKMVSSFYETDPVGREDQPKFINAVARVKTTLSHHKLLDSLKTVERQMGRKNGRRWVPRIIDLDVLFYENLVMESEKLTIPHKELHKRKFVLKPLCEIEPDLEHPVLRQTVSKMLTNLKDNKKVKKINQLYTELYHSNPEGKLKT